MGGGFGASITVTGKQRKKDDLDFSHDEVIEDDNLGQSNKPNFQTQNEEDIIEFHLNNIQKK